MAIDHSIFWERIVEAVNARRFAIFDEVFTEDFVEEYPQSGEVIRGRKNFRAILENYPRRDDNLAVDTATVRSQPDDAFRLVAPTYTIVKVHGGGDSGVLTMKTRYPDGSIWWVVRMYILKGGLVARATTFFAPEFPAPEWRAVFVERSG
jgi:SnoaL-like domain